MTHVYAVVRPILNYVLVITWELIDLAGRMNTNAPLFLDVDQKHVGHVFEGLSSMELLDSTSPHPAVFSF